MVLKQRENIKALVGGAMLPTITELFLLTFGDLKKHTFMYQFYSTAIPVQNYTILNRKTAAEAFSNEIPELNNYLRHFLSKGKQVDQLTVLKNWQISSLK